MESQRIGETSLSADSGPSVHHHNMHHALLRGLNPATTSFMYHSIPNNQEGPTFDFGELEEAIVLQGVKITNDEPKTSLYTATNRPDATVEMFPSWPTRFHETTTTRSSKSREESSDSGSALNNTLSSRGEACLEPSSEHQQTIEQMQQLQIPQQQHPGRASDIIHTKIRSPNIIKGHNLTIYIHGRSVPRMKKEIACMHCHFGYGDPIGACAFFIHEGDQKKVWANNSC